jgi:hypothetical protein
MILTLLAERRAALGVVAMITCEAAEKEALKEEFKSNELNAQLKEVETSTVEDQEKAKPLRSRERCKASGKKGSI